MGWFRRVIGYLNFVFIAIYFMSGAYLLFFGWLQFSKMQNLILGSALILYGIIRVYRVIKRDKPDRQTSTDDE